MSTFTYSNFNEGLLLNFASKLAFKDTQTILYVYRIVYVHLFNDLTCNEALIPSHSFSLRVDLGSLGNFVLANNCNVWSYCDFDEVDFFLRFFLISQVQSALYFNV